MPKYITQWAIERMRLELNRLEAQAKQELKDPALKPLGLLRIDLVEECRWFRPPASSRRPCARP